MNTQLELFGYSATLNDVELWLRSVPRFDDETRPNHVEDYIRGWDVVNKIIRAKSMNTFNHTVGIDKQNLSSRSLSQSIALALPTKYKSGAHHIRNSLENMKPAKTARVNARQTKPAKPIRNYALDRMAA